MSEQQQANLQRFLYVLLRDYLTVGQVEEIVQQHIEHGEPSPVFSNIHLAGYAAELADRLSGKV